MKGNFKKHLRIISSIVLLFTLLISTSVKGATISHSGYPPNMYNWDKDLFSAIHGAKLGSWDAWGNPSTATVYDTTSYNSINIEPSVGYAYYLANKFNNFNSVEMQNIIWSSGQWNNKSNMLEAYEGDTTKNENSVNAYRSYQYGTVYYQILKEAIDNNKNLFKMDSENEAVRVFVDQDTGEYTLGPYVLALNTNYTDEAAYFLYNEIIGENSGYTDDTAFAKYIGITGLNGDNEHAFFVDSNGNKIKFPNFVSGEIFYIRFKPDNDGAIQNTGKPKINVSYLQNFRANELIVYSPIAVQFGGNAGDYEGGNIEGVSNNNNQHMFEKVTDSTISSQYSTDLTPEQRIGSKKLEDLLNGKDIYTMPGETNEEAAGRRISAAIESNLQRNVPKMIICGIFEYFSLGIATPLITEEMTYGQAARAIASDVAGKIGERVTIKVRDGLFESAIMGFERGAYDTGKYDENSASEINKTAGRLQNFYYLCDYIMGHKLNPVSYLSKEDRPAQSLGIYDALGYLDVESNISRTGSYEEDILENRIIANILQMSKAGKISLKEQEYARNLVKQYGANASSYGHWIEAARNGYKLPLGLVMQAYGKPISNGDVSNKTVTSIVELPVFDTKGKLVEDKHDYHNAELEGEATLQVSIPTDAGNTSSFSVAVKVKKSIPGFILRGTREEAEAKVKEDSGDWEPVGFSSGVELFQVPATSLPVSIKNRGSVERLAHKSSTDNNLFQNAFDASYADDFSSGRKIINNYVEATEAHDETILSDVEINMHIDGSVFNDYPEKINADGNVEINGKIDSKDLMLHGLEVTLYEIGKDSPVAVTTTDENGRFSFFGLKEANVPLINPLKKYRVKYTYNGQLYQPTYFKNNISGLYSNAKEDNGLREHYNNTFKDIYSEYKGYEKDGEWHKSYSFTEKIKKDDDSFATVNDGKEPLTYGFIYTEFLSLAQQSKNQWPEETDGGKTWDKEKNYDWVLDNPSNPNSLSNWLYSLGVNSENKSIIQFIRDTNISAYTEQTYPVKNQFIINKVSQNIKTYVKESPFQIQLGKDYTYLYTKSSDQSRFVNFGLTQRSGSNMVVQNDIFKVTTMANGKRESYFYNRKDNNMWLLSTKAVDDMYNEKSEYTRTIRKSDYLFNTENIDNKNLEVYVTYKITCTNMGSTNVAVDEIVDYYDTEAYEFDGKIQNDNNTYDKNLWLIYDQDSNVTGAYYNSYIGKDGYGVKLNDNLVVKDKGLQGVKHNDLEAANYKYGTLYLTGITSANGNNILKPSESAYTYITFKVKKDNNKIKLDSENSAGKRNIAEINAYSSYYDDGTKIPRYLDNNDNFFDETIEGDDKTSGIVDFSSTPGSLSNIDLDDNGNLITGNMDKTADDGKKIYNAAYDHRENDIDQAPRLKLIIDDENDRKIRGYTFEDARNNTQNTGKAVIGNGLYKEGEGDKKIDGVTVELVELIADVDKNGTFKGTYSGERVWNSYIYKNNGEPTEDNNRYASGQGKSKIVISGTENLQVNASDLQEGEYEFKSIPPGDFFVRFKYGDTAETTMINTTKLETRKKELEEKEEWNRNESEKVELKIIDNIKEVNKSVIEIDGMSGKNQKSYNGQDYKSTIYQKDISQELSYNGIDGYKRIETQNYSYTDDNSVNNGTDKSTMYYYNIQEGDKHKQASDAKDVYYYRKKANDYSKGENGKTLLNNRSEVLSSFEKMSTYIPYEYDEEGNIQYEEDEPVIKLQEQSEYQKQMIKELMNNTQMVSQTGIINMEIEYDRKSTIDSKEELNYEINDLNLGLTERPVSQLSICNKVDNVKVVATNGKIIFDTNKSVNNLYYSEHFSHTTMFNKNPKLLMRTFINKNKKGEGTTDLIQAYMDDELRAGTTIELKYKMNVTNTGEVDYLDKEFYYNGIENDADNIDNISKTSAVKVIDYISNAMKFSKEEENQGENWKVGEISEFMPSTIILEKQRPQTNLAVIDKDYINRRYVEELNSYNTLLISSRFADELVPIINENGKSSTDIIELNISTDISRSSEQNRLAYNNLSEIIEISNSLGRRCRYSIVGNEEMADQNIGDNAKATVKTSVDRVKPTEIDADSSQKVLIMPPTGSSIIMK